MYRLQSLLFLSFKVAAHLDASSNDLNCFISSIYYQSICSDVLPVDAYGMEILLAVLA